MVLALGLAAQFGYGQTKQKAMGALPPSEFNAKSNQLNLLPNPASEKVELNFPSKPSLKNATLEVYDSRGTLLIQRKWDQQKLDVAQFPAGIYIVTLRKGKQFYSQKLIVNR